MTDERSKGIFNSQDDYQEFLSSKIVTISQQKSNQACDKSLYIMMTPLKCEAIIEVITVLVIA